MTAAPDKSETQGFFGRLTNLWCAESERRALWLPVLFGLGIAQYFALPIEPAWWWGPAGMAVAGLAAVGFYRRLEAGDEAGFVLAVSLAIVSAGFAVATVRTLTVAAPVIEARIGPVTVQGRITQVESLPEATRLTLERPRIPRVEPHRTPDKVRIRVSGKQRTESRWVPGMWIAVPAVLSPPPAPSAPGAFDFQRMAFFQRLGGVGYAVGRVEVTAQPDDAEGTWSLAVERLRQSIAETARAAIPGPAGAVAAALLTGDRSAIPEDVMQAMRDSGLAHLLAISGLHVGLVAGILFVGLRSGLALIPAIALRHPIKKWAAAAAIPGAFAYALVAGATVPTQRAFLMIGLVLLAVLFDRRGLSMRLVAWAAFVVLALQPESLLGASFQMSFAAVVALIAGYEALRGKLNRGERTLVRVVLFYFAGVAITTLLAGTATAPYAVYHFNRYAAFGLVANAIAVPITALWVMPCAVLAFALMPLGLADLALVPMGWGVAAIDGTAAWVAGWPGAVALLPAMPAWGLALLTMGGLWLCLWRRRWRLFGLAGIAIGMASILTVRPPDVLVDASGQLTAVRGADGALHVSDLNRGRFQREVWLRLAGQEEGDARAFPQTSDNALSCDALGCVYRARGRTVALARDRAALIEDCWRADAVIGDFPIFDRGLGRACRGQARVIDRFALAREGAHALWLDPSGIRVETVNGARGQRPWVPRDRRASSNTAASGRRAGPAP